MMKEIFQATAGFLRSEPPVSLVTVTRSIGSTPRHAAAKMVVRADGSFVGTIGGGTMEKKAIQDAQTAMTEHLSRLAKYPLIGKSAQSLGLCGGTQEVFIDVLSSTPGNGQPQELIDLCETIVAACQAGEPAALITVVKSRENAPWPLGAKALLRYDKSIYGKLGDDGLGPELVTSAHTALQQNRPMRLGYRA
ncbi:MAG TPA: XdhC family protein, partial [Anaerolineae bacterium]